MAEEERDHLLKVGLVGTVLACVACFTPAAVALLALVGLAGWVGYLDAVVFPLLGFFLMLVGYGYWRRRRKSPSELPAERGETVSGPTVTIYSTPT